MKHHFALLGLKVRDRVTGFEGIASTIGFDLYGCVQALVTPEMDKEGKLADSRWFDRQSPGCHEQETRHGNPDI